MYMYEIKRQERVASPVVSARDAATRPIPARGSSVLASAERPAQPMVSFGGVDVIPSVDSDGEVLSSGKLSRPAGDGQPSGWFWAL